MELGSRLHSPLEKRQWPPVDRETDATVVHRGLQEDFPVFWDLVFKEMHTHPRDRGHIYNSRCSEGNAKESWC